MVLDVYCAFILHSTGTFVFLTNLSLWNLILSKCILFLKWYDAAGLTEEEKKERMKSCRHRSKFEPTSTPEHYWSIGFPDTEACKERGTMLKLMWSIRLLFQLNKTDV